MSNQESVSYAPRAAFVPPAAKVGGGRVAGERAARARLAIESNSGPDAIWGQYNNYRLNGLAVSACTTAETARPFDR